MSAFILKCQHLKLPGAVFIVLVSKRKILTKIFWHLIADVLIRFTNKKWAPRFPLAVLLSTIAKK